MGGRGGQQRLIPSGAGPEGVSGAVRRAVEGVAERFKGGHRRLKPPLLLERLGRRPMCPCGGAGACLPELRVLECGCGHLSPLSHRCAFGARPPDTHPPVSSSNAKALVVSCDR